MDATRTTWPQKILLSLLAFVFVFGLSPVGNTTYAYADDAKGTESAAENANTFYLSISEDGKYVTSDGEISGTVMTYVPLDIDEIAKVNLDDYGLGAYKYDADDDGNYETTLLMAFVYALNKYSSYTASALEVTGAPGSAYMKNGFWGHDENLTYYVNGVYPLASASVGATADQIVLSAGDFADVAMYTDWDFFSDSLSGFHYFLTRTGAVTHAYTTTINSPLSVNLGRAWGNMTSGASTSITAESNYTIYYGSEYGKAEGKVTTDANGTAQITFSKTGTYVLWVDGGAGKDTTSIVNSPAYATVSVSERAFTVSLDTTPSDALISVTDSTGAVLRPNSNNEYVGLFGDSDYTYTVTKAGYVAATGKMPAENTVVNVELKKAGEQPAAVDSAWWNFRNSANNMGITSAKTPTNSSTTTLNWSKKLSSGWVGPNQMIIVDNALVTTVGTTIYKLDLSTGETIASGTMYAATNWGYTPMTYADGMIFVPIAKGVQAFNATTLESLWVYQDDLGGQSMSPIVYSDGYVYTGFWNGETKDAHYVCLSATDEDPTQTTETKVASWKHTQTGGFYWAGGVAIGNNIIVGTDDGTTGADGASHLLVFNSATGAVKQDLEITGDQRSSIAYDAENGQIWFTTKCGYLYRADVVNAGEVSKLTGVNFDAQSTSTPVVYKGKVYIGTGSGISSSGSSGNIGVFDASTMKLLYYKTLNGYPQSSPLLSTAYESSTGYIYLYSTYNAKPGGITMLKLKADATTADEVETVEIYDAAGYEEYCISSVICGTDGTLYYKNDSGNIFAVGDTSATWARLSGETRYGTMAAIDKAGYADESAARIILSSGAGFADALSASSLSGLWNAPVILTESGSLSAEAAAEIARVSDGSATVYIVGGENSVSASVEEAVAKIEGVSGTQRIAGADRIKTGLEIYKTGEGKWGNTAIITNAWGFADGLSIGSWASAAGAPIFGATGDGTLTAEAVEAIKAGGFTNIVVLGGNNAVKLDAVKAQLPSGISYTRLAGSDRYATSTAIVNWATGNAETSGDITFQPSAILHYDNMAVASGANFPDALAAIDLIGPNLSVLLLVDESDATKANIAATIGANASDIKSGYVLGGTRVVSDTVKAWCEEATE